jgi:ABC-2 type transport system permease protein
LGCVSYALQNGRTRLAERGQALGEAQRDEVRRIDALASLLEKMERGEAKKPDAPYRDPGNAIYVGRGQGATVAYLPDAPLAITSVGLSDLYPQAFKVSAGSLDSFLFVDDLVNPSHLLTGAFDFAFVVVYVYPLLILAVCSNVLSAEREQGTLGLVASSSAPVRTVLLGKLVARVGGVSFVLLAGLLAFLAASGPSTQFGSVEGLMALVSLAIAISIYGAFWASLALLVNSFGQDSAFNAVALVLSWVALLLVVPAAISALAQAIYPAQPRAEMVLAVREASVDAERDRDALNARYLAEHPDERPAHGGDDRTRRTLDVILAADARADAVFAQQERRVREQRRLADRLAFLSPPALILDSIAELAGNGHTRWDDYLVRVGEFHKTWQAFFVDRARRDAALTVADYADFPQFKAYPAASSWQATSLTRVTVALSSVALTTLALLFWSSRRLARSGV